MSSPRERILLVEYDPEISDLISRQTLQPMGYHVTVVGVAAQAIQEALRVTPDVIIVDLNLPGLSGKDLLVAFTSQGLEVPIIVMAKKGMEGDVIQAFRLGASDYILGPVREAEIVAVVERVLKQVRARREREVLSRQVSQMNEELQRRVRELTTIFALGKAVTSITDQRALLNKITESAIFVTEADNGWILLREERSKTFFLSACKNLPQPIADKLNQPWEDGISSLVALSGEPLSIHGDPLRRFKVASLGHAALVMPIKAQKEVIGVMVVMRKTARPFSPSSQSLLEAVADYASISLMNAQLFKVMEERARSLQQTAEIYKLNEKITVELLRNLHLELSASFDFISGEILGVQNGGKGPVSVEQNDVLRLIQEKTRDSQGFIRSALNSRQAELLKYPMKVELNSLARWVISAYQPYATKAGVTIMAELSSAPIHVHAYPSMAATVLEGILSNAIKFSHQGGRITIRVERLRGNQVNFAQLVVQDEGIGMDQVQIDNLFNPPDQIKKKPGLQFGGIGVGLSLIKEILVAQGGKIHIQSEPGKGSAFSIIFPVVSG